MTELLELKSKKNDESSIEQTSTIDFNENNQVAGEVEVDIEHSNEVGVDVEDPLEVEAEIDPNVEVEVDIEVNDENGNGDAKE